MKTKKMYKYVVDRTLEEANFLVANPEFTLRQMSELFGVSKSTIGKDLHERLKYVDKKLYKKVDLILKRHFKNKHIKGGIAIKMKWKGKNK